MLKLFLPNYPTPNDDNSNHAVSNKTKVLKNEAERVDTMNELNNTKKLSFYATVAEHADIDSLRVSLGYTKRSDFYKVLIQEGFRVFTEGKYTLGNMLTTKAREEAEWVSAQLEAQEN